MPTTLLQSTYDALALPRRRDADGAFRADQWEQRHRAACARAFADVPFYREQWASAGRQLSEPVPVRACDLQHELYRLCPLRSPWDPRREATLWTGELADLAAALSAVGMPPHETPVLDVRASAVDWTRFEHAGAPYGFLLSRDADVASECRRMALHLRALKLAVDEGRAVVVGPRDEVPEILRAIDTALGDVAVQWSVVHRMTLSEAAAAGHGEHAEPAIVHDPFLGYVAARSPECGEVHVLWDRIHVKASPDGLLFTRLSGRRPTLVNVVPVDCGFAAVGRCPMHGTPVLAA
jgi:hypothetical protein